MEKKKDRKIYILETLHLKSDIYTIVIARYSIIARNLISLLFPASVKRLRLKDFRNLIIPVESLK